MKNPTRTELELLCAWDPALETGLTLIDEQHQALFAQTRILLDCTQDDRIATTLQFLANYVVEHFGTEERLHRETDYPAAAEHLDAHNRFIETFKELNEEYQASGHDLLILMKITKVVLDWLRHHIGGLDREYGVYIHGLRPPPGDFPSANPSCPRRSAEPPAPTPEKGK